LNEESPASRVFQGIKGSSIFIFSTSLSDFPQELALWLIVSSHAFWTNFFVLCIRVL